MNAVLIAFIYVKSLRLHLMIAGLLALFVGLVMFVTADMDHPYQGSISVGPGAFERVIDRPSNASIPSRHPGSVRSPDRFMRHLFPPGAERRSNLGGTINHSVMLEHVHPQPNRQPSDCRSAVGAVVGRQAVPDVERHRCGPLRVSGRDEFDQLLVQLDGRRARRR